MTTKLLMTTFAIYNEDIERKREIITFMMKICVLQNYFYHCVFNSSVYTKNVASQKEKYNIFSKVF